jgi:YegS/Rv2252/BmrU family lipid kinase
MAGASEEVRTSRLFVVLNPKAGSYTGGPVEQALGRHFSCEDGTCRVHQAGGHEDLAALARGAAERGCEMVVAAGGDGTVSGVADGLVGTSTPLGILPLGTANVLARELGIPVGLEAACALLAGPHATASIDAMQVGGRHYYTQIGVGIDALMIRDTRREHKRRFGRVAYLWTALTRLIGFQPRRFSLSVDGRPSRHRASQVLVANSGTLGQPPLRWGTGIRPDDGRVDVCVVRARTIVDYLELTWRVMLGQHRQSRNVRYFAAERAVAIAARHPLPVQADGEIIGETPIEVRVVPGAVRVVVPMTQA